MASLTVDSWPKDRRQLLYRDGDEVGWDGTQCASVEWSKSCLSQFRNWNLEHNSAGTGEKLQICHAPLARVETICSWISQRFQPRQRDHIKVLSQQMKEVSTSRVNFIYIYMYIYIYIHIYFIYIYIYIFLDKKIVNKFLCFLIEKNYIKNLIYLLYVFR